VKVRSLSLAAPAGPLSAGPLSAELIEPESARALLVLAHGAGAGFDHANLLGISQAFAAAGVASLRFNFPFMQAGKRHVDRRAVATEAVAQALATAASLCSGLPLFVGGHSFGGRMASHAVLDHGLSVRGLIFCAFPLHPPKKPGIERAAHLAHVAQPMLFLSGTRDGLARSDLLDQVVASIGERAHLHWLATADHSYKILKRQRAPQPTVFEEMAGAVRHFVEQTSP
jgi:predicted alpha/beta-hydrolase family hydrolase